jgi:hypothetical protein
MKLSRILPPILALGCLVLFAGAVQASWAQTSPANPTTVTLSVSSNPATPGTQVTLTAVVVSGAAPVTAGQVVFCNPNAVHCEDAAILGSAWLTKSGTAKIYKVLGLGTYNVQAVFKGTNAYAASTSAPVAVAVTGAPLATATTISAAGATGNYALTATITTGSIVVPTGSVSFLDASNGNYELASAVLGAPGLAFSYASTLGPVADLSNRVIAVGDFNNDGYPDYVIATLGSSSTATIMTGNGDGTFTKGASYAVGAYPQGVVVADFNGDGNLDLAFASSSTTGVTILLGKGDGTFTTGTAPALTWAASIAVGDFNGDGIPDLAVSNHASEHSDYAVTILLGNGDGTFTAGSSVAVPQWSGNPQGMVAMDFNGDGKTDLAVTSSDGRSPVRQLVTILLGNGDGTFSTGQTYTTGSAGLSVAGGDFNGDGVPDLAIADFGSSTVTILLGNGDGTFTPAASPATGLEPGAIIAGDFNADGNLDLATANYGSSTVSILLGNGDGTFNASGSPATGWHPEGIAAGDLVGNGLLDIVTANYGATSASILLESVVSTTKVTASGVAVLGTGLTHNVFASYGGDNNDSPSQSSTIALKPTQIATTTAITVSPGFPIAGSATAITASISPSQVGELLPSGTVQFKDGISEIGTGTVSGGQATISYTFTTTGSQTLQAKYSGDANFVTSTAPADTVTVVIGTPTMNCTPQGGNTVTYGTYGTNPLITVMVQGSAGAIPSGTVSMILDSGSTPLETDSLEYYNSTESFVNAGGEYWTVLTGGAHTFTMKYSGDSNWAPTSCSVPITVLKDTPQLAGPAYSSANPALLGSPLTLGINYRDPLGCRTNCIAPSGTVSFYSDGTAIGTSPVTTTSWSSGYFSASVTIATLTAGTHTITAGYSGDTNYAAVAIGGAFTQTISPLAQTITFPNPGPQTDGVAPITLTATASSGLAVSYQVTSGPATVSGSTLTITGVGSVTVLAMQGGNSVYAEATPVSVTFTVSPILLTLTGTPPALKLGSILVGATTGNTLSLALMVPSAVTLGGVAAVTEGVPGLDFTIPSTTCTSGVTNTTCTLAVEFLPTAAGARLGALTITSLDGSTLLAVPMYGTGVGPLLTFGPGTITTIAGGHGGGYSGDGGLATAAQLNWPDGIAVDGAGNVYIADWNNNAIRMVTPGGIITTVAGGNGAGYSGDGGAATSAKINGPATVKVDGAGNFYIADYYNNVIRKVTAGGIISTVAGGGSGCSGETDALGDGCPATSAVLNGPWGTASDGAGNLYIGDIGDNLVRKVALDGTITIYAGTGTAGYSGDGLAATSAELSGPQVGAVDGSGNLYIVDFNNDVIRMVDSSGVITTVAGNNALGLGYSGDGGPATSAQLYYPQMVAVDGAGNLYIADTGNYPNIGVGYSVIRKVTPDGIISTVAGNGTNGYSGDGGVATSAEMYGPWDITVDASGNLYIADMNNNAIRKVTVTGAPSLSFPSTVDGATSAAQNVSLLNIGNSPLTILSISNTAEFSLGGSATTCATSDQTLAAGASCVLGIEFMPTTVGTITGSVGLTDNTLNVSGSTQTIALQGTGAAASQTITRSGPVTVQATPVGNTNDAPATTRVSDTFTVNPETQTITFANPGTRGHGTQLALTATSTSGLAVTYTSTTPTICTVSGTTATMVAAGTCTIQASQAGNGEYSAATTVPQSFMVTP